MNENSSLPNEIESFIKSARDFLEALQKGMAYLRSTPDDQETIKILLKDAQFLKQAAGDADLGIVGLLAGDVTYLLEDVLSGKIVIKTKGRVITYLEDVLKGLEQMVHNITNFQDERNEDIMKALQKNFLTINQEEEIVIEDIQTSAWHEKENSFYSDSPAVSSSETVEEIQKTEDKKNLVNEFRLEAKEHIARIEQNLLELDRDIENKECLYSIFRETHTLKGSAAIFGLKNLSSLSHYMEDLLDNISEKNITISREIVDLLFEGIDGLKILLQDNEDQIDESEFVKTLGKKYQALISELEEKFLKEEEEKKIIQDEEVQIIKNKLQKTNNPPETNFPSKTFDKITHPRPVVKPIPQLAEKKLSERRNDDVQSIRVNIIRLTKMMNTASELMIKQSHWNQKIKGIKTLGKELKISKSELLNIISEIKYKLDAGSSIASFAEQEEKTVSLNNYAAQADFDQNDDWETLFRRLGEISFDVSELTNQVNSFFENLEGDMSNTDTIIRNMQEEVTEASMLPVGKLFVKFVDLIKNISKAQGKEIELMIAGEDTILDKSIIEEVADPIMHLIQNSVAHGIEKPVTRINLGKKRTGMILLTAYYEGNHVVIEIEDDGAGIDLRAIKEEAIKRNIITKEAAINLTKIEIVNLIFHLGFSTAKEVTKIAGRGIGMSVVMKNIAKLHGQINIQTETGKGTKFIIKVPSSLTLSTAFIVQSGDDLFAVPINLVDRIIEVLPEQIESREDCEIIQVGESSLNIIRLDRVLGLQSSIEKNVPQPALVLSAGNNRVILLIDRLVSKEEIVIKNLKGLLSYLKFFSGATILSSGKIILILNVSTLIGEKDICLLKNIRPNRNKLLIQSVPGDQTETKNISTVKILVVDDSISTRNYTKNILTRLGFLVEIAKDGFEALQKTEKYDFDLVVTDLEMPIIAGFELIMELRQRENYKNIPFIVLSSRSNQIFKERAKNLGVNEYLEKPIEEELFIASIKKLLPEMTQANTEMEKK